MFFLYKIADSATLLAYINDLPLMALRGLRFDLKVICIAFSLPLLIGLVTAKSERFFNLYLRFSLAFSALIYFLICLFSIVNFYYYQTYGNYIDLFIFGLFDDDTSAVIDSIWTDYPVMLGLSFSVLISFLFTYLTKKSLVTELQLKQIRRQKNRPYLTGCAVFLCIALFFLFARGTLGSHPLKRYHANISDNVKLNIVTPNPFMALDWAKSDYEQQFTFRAVNAKELLASIEQVVKSDSLQQQTPVNPYLVSNRPNVVFALMESMATSILDEDDIVNNDVLASLRHHFQNDFLFKRFYAETSDTNATIVNLFVHSSVPNISHSTAAKVKMADSAVIPYKNAGYEIIFVNAGNGMWRNLFNYLPLQGFDKVYDENSIAKYFPEAADYASSWGVPDEFVFKFVQKILAESDKPVFICLLTVGNHSPYQTPDNYQPKVVKPSLNLQEKTELSPEQQMQMLQTYQYGADALGKFISHIKGGN
ncbi:sulfatase-like hydrolase/transferase [Psychromonas sp. MME2]|uniref:LTA synthase family protein n=1 Tax=Psychromonas sp. MME2 TaxID=3231033 RepID=UPI00339C127C